MQVILYFGAYDEFQEPTDILGGFYAEGVSYIK